MILSCPDANCGCEVTVTKGAPSDCRGQEQPHCCCGKTMEKVSGKTTERKRACFYGTFPLLKNGR